MSAFDQIVGLLDTLSWQEQLALIGVISERLRQMGSEPPEDTSIDALEEEPEEDEQGRQWQPRLRQMIDWGLITPMEDTLYVLGHPDQSVLLLDAYTVAYQGKRVPINDWAKSIKGWRSINVYVSVVVQREGRTLDEIRRAYMEQHGRE
jgi:hypothetical protein